MVVNAPFGLAGPKGMNPNIVKRLHDAFKKGMEDPSYIAALAQFDQEPMYLNSEDYRGAVLKQIAQETLIIEELGLRGELP